MWHGCVSVGVFPFTWDFIPQVNNVVKKGKQKKEKGEATGEEQVRKNQEKWQDTPISLFGEVWNW